MARLNSTRSISKPTKNIRSSLPIEEKKPITGPSCVRNPKPCGPSRSPASKNPITPGSLAPFAIRGRMRRRNITIEKLTRRGSFSISSFDYRMRLFGQL